MILAIEADGASYHSSPTTRVRDRLRQQHLERLGWEFHRIWSTDWLRDPEREVARVHRGVRPAVARSNERAAAAATAVPQRPDRGQVGTAPVANPARTPRPDVRSGFDIETYSTRQLDDLCRWIMSDTLLRTDDELLEAMMTELGFARRGKNIVAAISAAIVRVQRSG